ncbi:hypothetical protein [Streptomyces sp. CO7]
MSRTVRTLPGRLRVPDGAGESVFLHDLRHTHAATARAAREGRRPVPDRILRKVTSWQWMEPDSRDRCFAAWVATAEGRARLRCRLEAQRIRGLHRAGHDVDGADIVPVRHRHEGLWHAW